MKMTDALKNAQAEMQAGAITSEGFLGHDTRPLADIIQHDEELFARLGLEWETVAKKMRDLLKVGSDGLGEPMTYQNKWRIRVDETRGTLPSPWHDGMFHKVNAEVQLLEDGKPSGDPLVFNELCIHLLEKHHFLQGREGSFRLEPQALKRVLTL